MEIAWESRKLLLQQADSCRCDLFAGTGRAAMAHTLGQTWVIEALDPGSIQMEYLTEGGR